MVDLSIPVGTTWQPWIASGVLDSNLIANVQTMWDHYRAYWDKASSAVWLRTNISLLVQRTRVSSSLTKTLVHVLASSFSHLRGQPSRLQLYLSEPVPLPTTTAGCGLSMLNYSLLHLIVTFS